MIEIPIGAGLVELKQAYESYKFIHNQLYIRTVEFILPRAKYLRTEPFRMGHKYFYELVQKGGVYELHSATRDALVFTDSREYFLKKHVGLPDRDILQQMPFATLVNLAEHLEEQRNLQENQACRAKQQIEKLELQKKRMVEKVPELTEAIQLIDSEIHRIKRMMVHES